MALRARRGNQAALVSLLLAACGGGPQPADWQMNAAQAMQAYERLYFAGHTDAAEREFLEVKSQLGRTGRADLLARAELRRCAVRAAALEFDECPAFERLRSEAGKEEAAYAEYLLGKGAHKAGEEPVSRLVAAAVDLRKGSINPAQITQAVDTASAQGWRRPLLAWLGVQLKRAEAAGDSETAARVKRRMELVSGPGS
ncbi:MAG TPA: hypothetical protein VD965_01515 [Burkholderiales bacterium]|nr:hypothetical protein [Burkholderiales bacterium]